MDIMPGSEFHEHDGPIPEKAELAILGVIGCVGMSLNLLILITAILTLKSPRTLHLLLIILTSLDLISLAIYIPPYMASLYNNSKEKISGLACSAVAMTFYVCQGSSVIINSTLACSRAVLSRSQKKYIKLFTIKRTVFYVITASSVGTAALLICFVILASTRWQLHGDLGALCKSSGFHLAAYTSVTWPFVFFVPLYVTLFCYLRVYLCIRSVRDGGSRYKRDCYEGGFTFGMACLTLAALWLPYLTVKTYDPYQNSIPPFIHRIALYLVLCNSIANPLIYTLRVSDFRNGVSHLFGLPTSGKSMTDTLYNEDWGDLVEEFRERANGISQIGSRMSRASRSSKHPSRPMSRIASRKRPSASPNLNLDLETVGPPIALSPSDESRCDSTVTSKTFVAVHETT